MKAAAARKKLPKVKEPLQERSRETRRKIVEAARELFTEMGFEETTTHLIAERAGVSVGGLYAHFRNKEELFLFILEQRSGEIYDLTHKCVTEIVERDIPLDEALEYYFNTMYKAHIRHGRLNVEMDKFARMNPLAQEIHDSWESREMDVAGEWLSPYAKAAKVGDREATMVVMGRATHEVFHYLYKNRDRVDEKKVLRSLVLMFQRFLRASD